MERKGTQLPHIVSSYQGLYFPDSDYSRFPKVQEQLPESELAGVTGAKCALASPTKEHHVVSGPTLSSRRSHVAEFLVWAFMFLSDLEQFRVSGWDRGWGLPILS